MCSLSLPIPLIDRSLNQFQQFRLDVTWQFDRHLTLHAAYVHFNAGETITQAGGSNVELFVLQGTFRF